MHNLFVAPNEAFEHDVEFIRCIWRMERSSLPRELVALLGHFEMLKVYLELSVHPDQYGMVSECPFEASVEVETIDQNDSEQQRAYAERELFTNHLWTATQRKEGARIELSWDLPSSYEEFCEVLINSLLNSVLHREPKLTIRWDDIGMVAYVNFANAYISTREHAVKKSTQE